MSDVRLTAGQSTLRESPSDWRQSRSVGPTHWDELPGLKTALGWMTVRYRVSNPQRREIPLYFDGAWGRLEVMNMELRWSGDR